MMAAYFLMPINTPSGKRQLISDRIKGPLIAAFRSPLMKALDRSVGTLGLWIVTSSVTFIKSVNHSSIKPCLFTVIWVIALFCTISLFLHVFFKGLDRPIDISRLDLMLIRLGKKKSLVSHGRLHLCIPSNFEGLNCCTLLLQMRQSKGLF